MDNKFNLAQATEEAKRWANNLPDATHKTDKSNFNGNSNDGLTLAISDQEMRESANEFAGSLKSK